MEWNTGLLLGICTGILVLMFLIGRQGVIASRNNVKTFLYFLEIKQELLEIKTNGEMEVSKPSTEYFYKLVMKQRDGAYKKIERLEEELAVSRGTKGEQNG